MKRYTLVFSLVVFVLFAVTVLFSPVAEAAPSVPVQYDATKLLGTPSSSSITATYYEDWALHVVLQQPFSYKFCPSGQVLSKAGPFYQVGQGVTGLQAYVFQCVVPGDSGVVKVP